MICERSPWHCKYFLGAQSNNEGGRGMKEELGAKPRGEESSDKTPWVKNWDICAWGAWAEPTQRDRPSKRGTCDFWVVIFCFL